MEAVTGVFRSCPKAIEAANGLSSAGFNKDCINLLFPGASEEQVHSIPTSDAEQPGVGGAFGGVVGGTLGMVAGFELGITATAMIPGVGPVVAVGIAAAALLGVGGAVGGAMAGEAANHRMSQGLPADEVFFYEDALRQGRSVVIALAANKREMDQAREVFASCGAESLDAARDRWWLGLRDAEKERYRASGHDFGEDQAAFRKGFQAALNPEVRGQSLAVVMDILNEHYPDVWNSDAFRRGFERGQTYWANHEWEASTSRA